MGRKRVPTEFLGAIKNGHRHGVREYIDDDFALELLEKAEKGDQKALEALRWLTKFNNEYHKGVLKKGDKKALHKTKAHYKSVCHNNNAQRRDVLSRAREKTDLLTTKTYEGMLTDPRSPSNFEDVMIDLTSPATEAAIELLPLPSRRSRKRR